MFDNRKNQRPYPKILPVNIDIKGAMQVPRSIFDVGWYIKSAAPGTKGTSILDGLQWWSNTCRSLQNLNLLEKNDILLAKWVMAQMKRRTKNEPRLLCA